MLQRTLLADAGRRILTFTLPAEWAGRASVVGNFNDWTPGALAFEAVGDVAEASVSLPQDYTAVFRYLGEGGHWFDEPEADRVDGGGSVVLGVEPAEVAEASPSPAERAVEVAEKKRRKAEEKALKAVEKARRRSSDLAAKVAKAADKQRKAAARVAKEAERQARKAAEKAKKKGKK